MLPPKPASVTKKNVGIYIAEHTLLRAHAIAEEEGFSRNALLGSFMEFGVDFYVALKPLRAQVDALVAKANEGKTKPEERVTEAEVLVQLIERGLRAKK